jgi:RimJ/RimL family protein N-acetyltransferase
MLKFVEFDKGMLEELIVFLTTNHWPFHGQEYPKEESIRKSFEQGFYTENGNQTFWIIKDEKRIGMIRLFDLEDPTCLFDIRLKESHRGHGLGIPAVRWISSYVFENFPHMIRVEGHTRSDNIAMRKTFHNSGFVKEAYHRDGWPQRDQLFDSVGYAILRSDWENNTITKIEDPIAF